MLPPFAAGLHLILTAGLFLGAARGSAPEPVPPAHPRAAPESLWALVETASDSPGLRLARVRKAMAKLIAAGRYAAVDSLMEASRSHFAPGERLLFLYPYESILLAYLQGRPQAWADPAALERARSDLHLGFIVAREPDDEGPESGVTVRGSLVEALRRQSSTAASGIFQAERDRERQDFLLLQLHTLIVDGSDADYGYANVVREGEKFLKTYGDDPYARYARANFPHERTPTPGGFSTSLGYGGVSLESPATDRLGDPNLFAWDVAWYEGPFSVAADMHFLWGMKASEAFVYHGEWGQGWHLSAFDFGLLLGCRLYPLSPVSLEPHAGIHFFELNHEDGDSEHRGPDYRRMLGEPRAVAGLSVDWNWSRFRTIGNRYNPSAWYLRFTWDWLQSPMGSHRDFLDGDGLAFYVSLGGLLKGMR